jgi:uncharacterized protein involved in exopolysaccharide biosynthesis
MDRTPGAVAIDDDGVTLGDLFRPLSRNWKVALATTVVAGALGLGVSYLVKPRFLASNVFLLPEQQTPGAAALASLGALSSLVGGVGAGSRSVSDEYIALLESATISDRIIKRFDLRKQWDVHYLVDARKRLRNVTSFYAGKKDGTMHVEVTDTDPARAAAMANQYVEELRALNRTIAVTEAQQRRVFFEHLLEETRDKLAAAQSALERSGFTGGALNSEPRNAAETYARLKAELTSAQVKLQVLRATLADGSPQVVSQQQQVDSLAAQVAKLEGHGQASDGSGDYVNRYREFKYQETLFDLFARQYESARVDESREGALIQVLDPATPPEKKDWPRRSIWTAVAAVLGLLASWTWSGTRRRPQAA